MRCRAARESVCSSSASLQYAVEVPHPYECLMLTDGELRIRVTFSPILCCCRGDQSASDKASHDERARPPLHTQNQQRAALSKNTQPDGVSLPLLFSFLCLHMFAKSAVHSDGFAGAQEAATVQQWQERGGRTVGGLVTALFFQNVPSRRGSRVARSRAPRHAPQGRCISRYLL